MTQDPKKLHPTQVPLEDLNEEIILEDLPMIGTLPVWLEGTLIRNGPAKFHFGSQTISHWFDGLAMLHAFTIGNGKVAYRNKFLRSNAYFQAMDHNNLHFMGFAQDPCKSIFKRLFSYFLPSMTPTIIQNANVNIMRIAQHYAALTETPLPVRFDPHTLKTLGILDFQDPLTKKDCFESAHPHHDPIRKECINFQIDIGTTCRYTVYAVSDHCSPASRQPLFQMNSDKAAYIHSFAITPRYVILVEYPLVLNPLDFLLKGGGYITQFKWEPGRTTRFHVINRSEGSLVHSFETESFFSFHHVNAYEEKETIVVDLVKYPDPRIVFGEPPLDQVRQLMRFRLNLRTSTLSSHPIADTALELPRIFYRHHNGMPYQFVYGVGFHYPSNPEESIPLLKIDVEKGSIQEWKEPGALASEPVFIPRPEGKGEDDGLLLSVILNQALGSSYLLVLDARNLEEIARSAPIHPIPYGLHGMFFDL